jgi:hypothetical protein
VVEQRVQLDQLDPATSFDVGDLLLRASEDAGCVVLVTSAVSRRRAS